MMYFQICFVLLEEKQAAAQIKHPTARREERAETDASCHCWWWRATGGVCACVCVWLPHFLLCEPTKVTVYLKPECCCSNVFLFFVTISRHLNVVIISNNSLIHFYFFCFFSFVIVCFSSSVVGVALDLCAELTQTLLFTPPGTNKVLLSWI